MTFLDERNRLILPISKVSSEIHLSASMFPEKRDLNCSLIRVVLVKERRRGPARLDIRRTGGGVAECSFFFSLIHYIQTHCFMDDSTGSLGFVSSSNAYRMFSSVWSFISLFFSIFDIFNTSPLSIQLYLLKQRRIPILHSS